MLHLKYLSLLCLFLVACNGRPSNNQLNAAVKKNDQAKVDVLLDRGVDINGCSKWGWHLDNDGETALTSAAQLGHEKLVKHLLTRGAKINQLDGHGNSAIHSAIFSKKLSLVKFLHKKGADIHLMKDKSASIRLAAALHHKEIIKFLIANGASVNAKGTQQYTALHSAISSPETIELLLGLGADKTAKNSSKKTPLDLAENLHQSHLKHGSDKVEIYAKAIELLQE